MPSEPYDVFTFYCERRGCERRFVVYREQITYPRRCPLCQEGRIKELARALGKGESGG